MGRSRKCNKKAPGKAAESGKITEIETTLSVSNEGERNFKPVLEFE